MIREDYILGWIKRYVLWLAEIAGFLRTGQPDAAVRRIDMALRCLLGLGSDSMSVLSEGEIIARLALAGPTHAIRDKCVVLAALLRQLALVFAAQGRPAEARDCTLKALHIVLGLQLEAEPAGATEPGLPRPPAAEPLPDFAPKVEALLDQLGPGTLPVRTFGAVLVYHEQAGRYAKAEDFLFAQLEAGLDLAEGRELGLAFYDRLEALSDAALEAGDLPRDELHAGRAELQSYGASG